MYLLYSKFESRSWRILESHCRFRTRCVHRIEYSGSCKTDFVMYLIFQEESRSVTFKSIVNLKKDILVLSIEYTQTFDFRNSYRSKIVNSFEISTISQRKDKNMVFVRLDFPNTIFLGGNVNHDRVFNVQ